MVLSSSLIFPLNSYAVLKESRLLARRQALGEAQEALEERAATGDMRLSRASSDNVIFLYSPYSAFCSARSALPSFSGSGFFGGRGAKALWPVIA